jgi:DNA repair exonuclease SbcCD ATPase subunit
MKQQEGMYERKLAEAKEWLEYDKGRLAEFGVTFDEMGNINNYDEVIEAAVAEYNAFVERYNAMSADEQKTSDENEEQQKAEEKLENLKEYISDYEDSINNIYDMQNQILEAQNQQSALSLEKIQYKAEYQIEINEDDMELLEYFDQKWEEVLDKQDDRLAGMIEQGAELHDTLSLLATE